MMIRKTVKTNPLFFQLKSGFVLIETFVCAVAIVLLLSFFIPSLYVTGKAVLVLTAKARLHEEVAIIFDGITKEARRVKDNNAMLTVLLSEFSFVNLGGETTAYRLNASKLERKHMDPAETLVLANNVKKFRIIYLGEDDDGDGTPDLLSNPIGGGAWTNIRHIQFQIVLQNGLNILEMRTATCPRNIRHESDLFF